MTQAVAFETRSTSGTLEPVKVEFPKVVIEERILAVPSLRDGYRALASFRLTSTRQVLLHELRNR